MQYMKLRLSDETTRIETKAATKLRCLEIAASTMPPSDPPARDHGPKVLAFAEELYFWLKS